MNSHPRTLNHAAHQAGFGVPMNEHYPQNDFQGADSFGQQFPPHYQPPTHAHSSHSTGQVQGRIHEGADKKRSFMQVAAYGTKCAVQCEAITSQTGWYTVSFEAAKKASSNPNDRKYNWKNKLSLHLTQSELPFFIAFAYGLLPSVRFENHGDTGKWLEIKLQDKGYFCRIGSNQKDSLHAVPIGFAELTMFGALAIGQYAKNFQISADAALEGIKLMANLAYNAGAYPAART